MDSLAASKGDIRTRITLDGDKEYRQGLKAIYDQVRVLRSEQEREVSALGREATEQQKATVRAKYLRKEEELMAKALTLKEQRLKELKKQYPEQTAAINQQTIAVNKSATAYNKLSDELAEAAKSMREAKGAIDSANDSLTRGTQAAAGRVVSVGDVVRSVVDSIKLVGSTVEGVFSASMHSLEELASHALELMQGAWAAAGDYKELQAMWGGDAGSIEQVLRGAQATGHAQSTVTSAIQRLVQRTHSGDKSTAEALRQLGISEESYASHWDYFLAVMDAASTRTDEGRRSELLENLLGKQGDNLASSLDDWQAIRSWTGPMQGSEGIEVSDAAGKGWSNLEATLDALKDWAGKELTVRLNILGLQDDTLDILNTAYKLFAAGDAQKRQELTADLTVKVETWMDDAQKGVENLATWLEEVGNALTTSDNGMVSALGKGLLALRRLLDWVADHADDLITVMEWWLKNAILKATSGKNAGEWVDTAVDVAGQVANMVMWRKLGAKGSASAAGKAMTAAGKVATGAGMGAKILSVLGKVGMTAVKLAPLAIGAYAVGKPATNKPDAVIGGQNYYYDELYDKDGNPLPWAKEAGVTGPGQVWGPENWERNKRNQQSSQMTAALEEWWDDYRRTPNGAASWDSMGHVTLDNITGDDELMDRIHEEFGKLDLSSEDIPAGFWLTMEGYLKQYMDVNKGAQTGEDTSAKTTEAMRSAVEKGAREGVRGMTVMLDGDTIVGYISQRLGGEIVTLY